MEIKPVSDYHLFSFFNLVEFKDTELGKSFQTNQITNCYLDVIVLLVFQLIMIISVLVWILLQMYNNDNYYVSLAILSACLIMNITIFFVFLKKKKKSENFTISCMRIIIFNLLVVYFLAIETLYIPLKDSSNANIIQNIAFMIFCTKAIDFHFLLGGFCLFKFLTKLLVNLYFFLRSDILGKNYSIYNYLMVIILLCGELYIEQKNRVIYLKYERQKQKKENYKQILDDQINSSILILKQKTDQKQPQVQKEGEDYRQCSLMKGEQQNSYKEGVRFSQSVNAVELSSESLFALNFMNQQCRDEFQIKNESDMEVLFRQFLLEEQVVEFQGRDQKDPSFKSPQSQKIRSQTSNNQNLYFLLTSFYKSIDKQIETPQRNQNQKFKEIKKEFIFNFTENGLKTIFNIEMSSIDWNGQIYCLLILQNIDQQIMLQKQSDITKFQDQMIHSITHNLKTPLNCIMLSIKSSKMISDFDKIQQNISMMNYHSQLLLSQIDDVIDYSRISNNSLVLNLEHFNLQKLLDEVKNICSVHLRPTVMIIIKFHIEQLDSIIFNDLHRVKQILISILGNSIKYTYAGYIMIIVEKIQENEIRVTVQDTGIGMRVDKLNSLLDLLQDRDTIEDAMNLLISLENVNSEDFSCGSGLGLLITKKLINRVGTGNIQILSTQMRGTTVSFEIYVRNQNFKSYIDPQDFQDKINPYGVNENFDQVNQSIFSIEPSQKVTPVHNNHEHQSSQEDLEYEQQMAYMEEKQSGEFNLVKLAIPKHRRSSLKLVPIDDTNAESIIQQELIQKKQILIVDDTQFNIEALKELLWQFNEELKIDEVYDGQSAIDIISEQTNYEITQNQYSFYDIIFMDVNMPILDGFKATKAIRNQFGPYVFIIIVTAYSDQQDIQQSVECGADFHLSKPISLIQLAKALQKRKNFQESSQLTKSKAESPLFNKRPMTGAIIKRNSVSRGTTHIFPQKSH